MGQEGPHGPRKTQQQPDSNTQDHGGNGHRDRFETPHPPNPFACKWSAPYVSLYPIQLDHDQCDSCPLPVSLASSMTIKTSYFT